MKAFAHRLLTLMLLLTVMVWGRLCAQVGQTLYNNDTTYLCVCQHSQDGISHSYAQETSSFDSWGVVTGLDTSFTLKLTIIGSQTNNLTCPINGYVDVWDGDTNGTLLVNHYSADSIVDMILPFTGNRVVFHVHYNEYSTDTALHYRRYFSLNWVPASDVGPSNNPCNSPQLSDSDIIIDNITATEADLHYTPNNIALLVSVDGRNFTATNGTLHLSGLSPNTHYVINATPYPQRYYNCCRRKKEFYTQPAAHYGCPDVLDLHSDYVRCFVNNYYGAVDDYIIFPNSSSSDYYLCHAAIHTDTNEVDPATCGMLHTVGPGLPGSVRLGNRNSGAERESIVYYLHVDTLLYSLIMLHYAAVLQNPEHDPSAQPRFTMQILDQNDNVIDPTCGAADFVANASLGWNNCSGILWKDWTTVGINLAPYHGQDVKLKFTTYDCAMGAHYGYAYFYAECQQPSITSEHCGTVDTNTLTAPDGFNYLWYYNSPSNPVATTQSYTYSSSQGTIHCRLSFIENPSCHVTLSTYVSNFWPQAAIDTLYTINRGCDGYEVLFLNRSTILGDDSIPQPGNPPCESALWFFGDGYISATYSPTHIYQHPGTYTVTLISGLVDRQCTDTVRYTLVVPDAWAPVNQYYSRCDSIFWLDSIWYSHDTVGPSVRIPFPETCDTVYTLHLNILPTMHHYLPPDTICYNSSYYWREQTVPVSQSITDTLFYLLSDTLVGSNGCDSIEYLQLVQLPTDPLNIEVQPDCGLSLYLLTAATENPFWRWSSSPYDPSLEGHEGDRQLWVFPDTTVTYYLTSYYGDSLFCPTTTAKKLSPPTFPKAELEVNPAVLTYEKQTLYAYDRSSKYNHRWWAIVNHGATHDTVHLPDTLQRITYPVTIVDYDSVTVILTVSNAFCHDTASQTLPIVRSALFAPNVFIPDAERNNRLSVVCNGVLEAELTIYNRQGLFVFSTTDLETGWDGTHNGQPCPQGAYVWHLHYRTVDRPEQWNTQIGTVTLLR